MKDLRTTILGLLSAILMNVAQYIQTQSFDWKTFMVSIILAAAFYFAKDADLSKSSPTPEPPKK
jgi:hypothetical protein